LREFFAGFIENLSEILCLEFCQWPMGFDLPDKEYNLNNSDISSSAIISISIFLFLILLR
jgi:hypothetical protein